jgi:hypothetical protein
MSIEKDVYEDSSDLSWLEEQIEFVDVSMPSYANKENRNRNASMSTSQDQAGISEYSTGCVKFVYSEEQKEKWRTDNRWRSGYQRPAEDRKKISDGHQRRKELGLERKPASEESDNKRSETLKAKYAAGYKRPPISEETRQKMRIVQAERHLAARNGEVYDISKRWAEANATRKLKKSLGISLRPVSDETKQKIKAAWMRLKENGYIRAPLSSESRERMSQAKKKFIAEHGAKKTTEEAKQKIRDAYALRLASGWKPPRPSAETKAKIRATKAARADLYAARAEQKKKAKKEKKE